MTENAGLIADRGSSTSSALVWRFSDSAGQLISGRIACEAKHETQESEEEEEKRHAQVLEQALFAKQEEQAGQEDWGDQGQAEDQR